MHEQKREQDRERQRYRHDQDGAEVREEKNMSERYQNQFFDERPL